jgi:hypothetical protein
MERQEHIAPERDHGAEEMPQPGVLDGLQFARPQPLRAWMVILLGITAIAVAAFLIGAVTNWFVRQAHTEPERIEIRWRTEWRQEWR